MMVRYGSQNFTGMKHTESGKKKSRSRTTFTSEARSNNGRRLVVCVNNDDYPASLELRKIYVALPDRVASDHGMIRVIDESGEDYLFPEEFFIPIELPAQAKRAVLRARQSV
jgi:hypothetical protein